MLPVFHAAGRFSYAKAVHLYLQDMVDLEMTWGNSHPEQFRQFTEEGFFTVRRSNKPWCGIWTDMATEQTLNRFFGTDLKHGRGTTASVLTKYFANMPTRYEILQGLETYSGITTTNSEQHKDLPDSRMNTDDKHLSFFREWIDQHKPLSMRTCNVMSLSTGIVGNEHVNCHKVYAVGQGGMKTLVGQNLARVSLSSYKVKNLDSSNKAVMPHNQWKHVNATLLFQRMAVKLDSDQQNKEEAFEYELSPIPLSLFDKAGVMRKGKKAELYDLFEASMDRDVGGAKFVIDGGFLLRYVVWSNGMTFGELCKLYSNHLAKNYSGAEVHIVFDGYESENASLKSYERIRRGEKIVPTVLELNASTPATLKQADFLSSVSNKGAFIKLLTNHLRGKGFTVRQAPEDADALIVTTAMELKEKDSSARVLIVGTDVDLFVIALGLSDIRGTHVEYLKKGLISNS